MQQSEEISVVISTGTTAEGTSYSTEIPNDSWF